MAPILYKNCVTCHRVGGEGPFSLETYPDVARRARQIVSVTSKRIMPPWMPEPGYGDFEGERRLAEQDIAVLARWADAGVPEGDPARLPPRPTFAEGWRLGQPDLVLSLTRPVPVPAEGPDLFQTVRIPTTIARQRFVRAVEFRQGGAHVVHHAMIRLAKGAQTALDAMGEPSLGGMIFDSREAVSPDGHVLGWAPGYSPYQAPPGMPWRLDPGVDVLLELHLKPSGLAELAQPEIGLFFTDEAPTRTPFGVQLGSFTIDIPPGEAAYVIEDRYTLPVDVDVHTVYPHAHYLGKDLRGFAELPDGTRRELVWIRNWDFNWQNAYRYKTPVFLPRGTTVVMRYVYDNSAENPRNPTQPPVRVRYGGQSGDEMGNLWLQVVPRRRDDFALLQRDYAAKAASRVIDAYETLVRSAPTNASLERAVGTSYLETGRPAKALEHLERAVAMQPQEPSAHYNLGHALAAQGRFREAEASFRAAVRLNPAFAEAHNNLGEMLRMRGAFDDALAAYRQAIALTPGVALFHANVAAALRARGQADAAMGEYEVALELDARLPEALFGMGLIHHQRGRLAEAVSFYRRTLEVVADHPEACNALAWILATTPSPGPGQVQEALSLATKAVRLTQGQDASSLDTLAVAQAASGEYARAASTAQAAMERATRSGQDDLAREIARRIALYRRSQPYRES